jgi:ATP-dependent Lhr-like helicase
MIGLERLRKVTGHEFQRIGLSATVGNPEQIGAFIAGNRPYEVIQVLPPKEAKYFVEFPHPTDEDNIVAQSLYTAPEAAARLNRIWELVEDHESTLIFVNSRTNAETLGSKFHQLKRNVGKEKLSPTIRSREPCKSRCSTHQRTEDPVEFPSGSKIYFNDADCVVSCL